MSKEGAGSVQLEGQPSVPCSSLFPAALLAWSPVPLPSGLSEGDPRPSDRDCGAGGGDQGSAAGETGGFAGGAL